MQIMQGSWNELVQDPAKKIMSKFKALRKALRVWSSSLSSLAETISNTKQVILFLNTLEEARDLTLEEWNFRATLLDHLANLLSRAKTITGVAVKPPFEQSPKIISRGNCQNDG